MIVVIVVVSFLVLSSFIFHRKLWITYRKGRHTLYYDTLFTSFSILFCSFIILLCLSHKVSVHPLNNLSFGPYFSKT